MQEYSSKVNVKKLVRDLADMYSDHPFDVVITELVANSLDAKAKTIDVSWNDDDNILVVSDDGNGMDAVDFSEYHDFAAELKSRGSGIGFAGIGAKISFNIANRVLTKTRTNGVSNASDWWWHEDGSLRWKHIRTQPLPHDGTRVEVRFDSSRTLPKVDDAYLVQVLKRHYLPLFITEFTRSYSAIKLYTVSPRFRVNGTEVGKGDLSTTASLNNYAQLKLRVGNRSIGWGALGVSEREFPTGNTGPGVLLCTFGKVVKAELFGQSTGALGANLFGIVEIPDLVNYLTTNKSDLKRGPGVTRDLNRLLDPVREHLKAFLQKHGVAPVNKSRNQLSSKLERELTKMVKGLPELRDFDGLLRKSNVLRKSTNGSVPVSTDNSRQNRESSSSVNGGSSSARSGGGGGRSRKGDEKGNTRAKLQRSRRNQGPRVAFETHPARSETAWIDSNTIVINSGHSAYPKGTGQEQLTYCMFAMGIALDKAEVVQVPEGESYVDKFITAWGQS